MKIETILNALCLSRLRSNDFDQFNKFFDRILMKFDAKEMLIQLQHMKISSQREQIAEKDAEIERLHGRVTENILFIVRRDAIIREKDDRIAELEAEIDIRDKALDDSQVDLEMWRE